LPSQHRDWAGITPLPAQLAFGSYKPTDKASVLELVANGVDKGVISLETGVKMLIEAGFPIEDAAQEIERIQARQFAKARDLADATGDTNLVGDFLGVKVAEPPPAPAPNLPSTTPGVPDPTAVPADGGAGAQQGAQGSGGNTA
jgi:hypothetical protein